MRRHRPLTGLRCAVLLSIVCVRARAATSAGCTGCRVGCDQYAACPYGCNVDPLTGLDGPCRRGCNVSTGEFYERSNSRVCTTDERDYLDGKVNQRCVSGWRKRNGSSKFGCRSLIPSACVLFFILKQGERNPPACSSVIG